jgi:orotidine-5'-phosphate decarboxylase
MLVIDAKHLLLLKLTALFNMKLQFIKDAARGVFILCKTSNPSSAQIQTLPIAGKGHAVFEEVALLAQTEWNTLNNVGLVVGATDHDALTRARAIAPDLWILAPGEHYIHIYTYIYIY